MTKEPTPVMDNRSRALLQAGREYPAVTYDVEVGLSRHRYLVGLGVPLPPWAESSSALSAKTGLTLSKLIPLTAIPVAAIGVIVTLNSGAPIAPTHDKGGGPARAARAVSVSVPEEKLPVSITSAEPTGLEKPVPDSASQSTATLLQPKVRETSPRRKVPRKEPSPAEIEVTAIEKEPDAPIAVTQKAIALEAVAPTQAPRIATAVQPTAVPMLDSKVAPQDDQFEREISQVAAAERLLRNDPERALYLARSGESAFRNGYFSEERRYIIVIALTRLRRLTEAQALATRFLNDYPNSNFSPKIRKALSEERGGQ